MLTNFPFSILHEALAIRPTDQSCHHEAWLHLDFVEWRDEQPHREKRDRRILLKERFAPYHHENQKGHISDVVTIRRRYVGRFLSTRTARTSSPSDLMTLPHLTATPVSFFPRSVIHIACMTISTRRATKKKTVSKRFMGRMSFCKLFRYWHHNDRIWIGYQYPQESFS